MAVFRGRSPAAIPFNLVLVAVILAALVLGVGACSRKAELPGERKLTTNTLLSIGEHSVRVEAFVCRKPDENFEGVYRFLLKRNRRLYGVAYTLDNIGDIYLIGRMALDVVNPEEIDRILGQVVEAVNNDFNTLLELGFATSIRKEWAWRLARGESLKNLAAFRHLIDQDPGGGGDGGDEPEPADGASDA